LGSEYSPERARPGGEGTPERGRVGRGTANSQQPTAKIQKAKRQLALLATPYAPSVLQTHQTKNNTEAVFYGAATRLHFVYTCGENLW